MEKLYKTVVSYNEETETYEASEVELTSEELAQREEDAKAYEAFTKKQALQDEYNELDKEVPGYAEKMITKDNQPYYDYVQRKKELKKLLQGE